MNVDFVTKDDLEKFRMQLLEDLQRLIHFPKAKSSAEWIKSSEVRKLLKISPNTLVSLRATGKLHPVKLGGILYYRRNEIDEMFQNLSTPKD
ncbi:MAG: helix-turn-helix domain-containing protein [Bacteroidetes bacterium]|nr:helix-turn-helix domain-containing protein [Bacteroidota bacterium]